MKMRRALLGFLLIFIVFCACEVAPGYSTMSTPKTVVTKTTTTLEILEEVVTIHMLRYDTYIGESHYISFRGSATVGTTVMSVIMPSVPYYLLESFLSSNSSEICSIPEEQKELWDGILTVMPGPVYVKYPHPDNYDTYHPGETDINYSLNGTTRIHSHIAQSILETGKLLGELTEIVGGILVVVAALGFLPEPLISKVHAAYLGLLAGILMLAGLSVAVFIEYIVQSELGDGWTWLWGFCSSCGLRWWYQSFGRLRDVGWLFVLFDSNGSPFPLLVRGRNFNVYACTL
jgi:hypothetical protein